MSAILSMTDIHPAGRGVRFVLPIPEVAASDLPLGCYALRTD
jgi:hypothetical protein